MRIAYHSHIPAIGEAEMGGTRTTAYQGMFLDAMAENCHEVVFIGHSPTGAEEQHMDYRLQAGAVKFADLGKRISTPVRAIALWKRREAVAKVIRTVDVVLTRGPTPLLPALARLASGKPRAFLIVGDNVEGARESHLNWWRKQLITMYWRVNRRAQLRLSRSCLVFANNSKALQMARSHAARAESTITTTISAADILRRADTCGGREVRLLYTGRMCASKGIEDLASAMLLLLESGLEVALDLAGWSEKGDTTLERVLTMGETGKLKGRIRYHGFRPAGQDLLEFYKRADIYVLGSQSDFEGFPRTLWEAFSQGLPVVTCDVGGIRDMAGSAVYLVPPRSPKDIANGIRTVFADGMRRRRMIAEGLQLVQEATLERQVGKMMDTMREWIRQCGERRFVA